MNQNTILKAPFPWFGGKSRVASIVWEAFGNVPNYVEPFAGSLAVLLGRPHKPHTETINDKDCYVANFWRALKNDPESVALHADNPVNEADLSARHLWLVKQKEFHEHMKTDPDYFNTKIAGWWVWGLCIWIGSGWCERMTQTYGKRVHLGSHQGINRQVPYLGVGQGINSTRATELIAYMQHLSKRLQRVRVCCGDWVRICGPTPTFKQGLTGVFLDPPYSSNRQSKLYSVDSGSIAFEVRKWAIENGNNKLMRIALCGHDGEYFMPETWKAVPWKATGGYGSQGNNQARKNASREMIWFSPHCLSRKLI